jgi:hypothetical protein
LLFPSPDIVQFLINIGALNASQSYSKRLQCALDTARGKSSAVWVLTRSPKATLSPFGLPCQRVWLCNGASLPRHGLQFNPRLVAIDAVDRNLASLRGRFQNFSIGSIESDRLLLMDALDDDAVNLI